MIDKMFNPITLLSGPILVCIFAIEQQSRAGPTNPPLPGWNIAISYILWLLLTRAMKLLPHLVKRPQDIIHIPAWLIFNYYFAVMKIYALFTLHEVGWGTRAGVGTTLAADIAKETEDEKNKAAEQEHIKIQISEDSCEDSDYDGRLYSSQHNDPNALNDLDVRLNRDSYRQNPFEPRFDDDASSAYPDDFHMEQLHSTRTRA
jgi:hypothetical protein